jgi:peptidoglycan/xylan/chitin deacetylase (PgdA/CDA1 family)
MRSITEKQIFLTFDDGPTPEITTRVLSLLKEFNAKATFFCVGKNVEAFPEIFNEIIEQGHSVGNHSYSHRNGWKSANKTYINDVRKASLFVRSKLFRPPYGKISPLQWLALRKEYKIITWTCLSKDYEDKIQTKKILNRIIKATHPGAILVFHDSKKAWKNLENVLPKYLEFLKSQKYNCLPLNF